MFAQSPDQQLFEQFTDRFLDDHYPIGRARELAQAQSVFEPDVWRQAAALGWTTPLVPEEAGGGSVSGNGLADLLIVAAAFGRRAAPGPLFGANIVAAALGRWGSAAQRGGPLAELLAGEAVAAWAHATTGGPLRQDRCRVTEVRSGAEVMLNGPAGCAEGAADASYLLVTAGEAGRTHSARYACARYASHEHVHQTRPRPRTASIHEASAPRCTLRPASRSCCR